MKSFYFVTVLFASFILFTACGGESCEGTDCGEPADEISVTDDENVDNEIPDSDILIEDTEKNDDVPDDTVDSEPSDNEEIPDEDQGVTADCSKLLDIVGDWIRIDDEGQCTITVNSREVDCEVVVLWTKGYSGEEKWYGLELPLTYWSEEAYIFLTLKKDGENLVRDEISEDGKLMGNLILQKIQ